MLRATFLILVLIGALAALVAVVAGLGFMQAAMSQATDAPPAVAATTAPSTRPASRPTAAPAAVAVRPTVPGVVPPPPGAVDAPPPIALPVAEAVVNGFDLRLEGVGKDKRAVNWKNGRDALEWPVVTIPRTGLWEVELEYACDPIEGGGTMRVVVGTNSVNAQVLPTRSWGDYQTTRVNLYVRAGEWPVLIRPTAMAGGQKLMNVKSAKLRYLQDLPGREAPDAEPPGRGRRFRLFF